MRWIYTPRLLGDTRYQALSPEARLLLRDFLEATYPKGSGWLPCSPASQELVNAGLVTVLEGTAHFVDYDTIPKRARRKSGWAEWRMTGKTPGAAVCPPSAHRVPTEGPPGGRVVPTVCPHCAHVLAEVGIAYEKQCKNCWGDVYQRARYDAYAPARPAKNLRS